MMKDYITSIFYLKFNKKLTFIKLQCYESTFFTSKLRIVTQHEYAKWFKGIIVIYIVYNTMCHVDMDE